MITSDEIAATKNEYTHTRTEDLTDGCPIGNHGIPDACFDCTYTDRVGYCVHPVDIDTEIKAGRAKPMYHNPMVPEVIANRKLLAEARAFRAVDKR